MSILVRIPIKRNMTASSSDRSRHRAQIRLGLLVTVCVLYAFAARVFGIHYGLPQLYYWDEPTVVNRAVRFGSGDLNPHFFVYPAFYMYVLFGASGVCFLFERLTGHCHSVQDFASEYFVDPSYVYLTARLLTAIFGAMCVLATYHVGRRFFNARVGLIGALFLSVSVLQCTYSHIAITDIPHSFFIIAAYIPIYHVLRRSSRCDYLLAGVTIGLGIATKYLAILLVPTLLLAHLWRDAAANSGAQAKTAGKYGVAASFFTRDLALSLTSAVLAFFVGAPYSLLQLRACLTEIRSQQTLSAGIGGSRLGLLLWGVLTDDYGIPLVILAGIGFVWLVSRRRRTDLIFLCFPVLYMLSLARYSRVFDRYMIPEDPFLALMAAYALTRLYKRVANSFRKIPVVVGLAIASAVVALPAVITCWRWDFMMQSVPDTRTTTLNWVHSHIPAQTKVAIQPLYNRTFMNVPLLTDVKLAKLSQDMPNTPKFQAIRQKVLDRLRSQPVYREISYTEDYDTLKNAGAVYLFISDAQGKLSPFFKQQLRTRGHIIYRCAPSGAIKLGIPKYSVSITPPVITVYRLD